MFNNRNKTKTAEAEASSAPPAIDAGKALKDAIWTREAANVERVLRENPQLDVNAIYNNESYLGTAVFCQSLEMTKALVAHGADVNIRDNCGMTPLMNLARTYNGNEDLLRYLLAQGAEPAPVGRDDENAFGMAAFKNAVGMMRILLEKFPEIDINRQRSDGLTVLMLAAAADAADAVKLLLEKGADIGAIMPSGNTAADIADLNGKRSMGMMLRILEGAEEVTVRSMIIAADEKAAERLREQTDRAREKQAALRNTPRAPRPV